MIRHINDPEHPNTLEELSVVYPTGVTINRQTNELRVEFTPTIPNCGMATLIGLMIRVKLIRSLPEYFKIDVYIARGAHEQEVETNK